MGRNRAERRDLLVRPRQTARVSRRRVMQLGVGMAAGASLGPWILRSARASSGELNIAMWSDYLPEAFLKSFEADTGIKVNHTKIGSNEQLLEIVKASGGEGFDLVSPTNIRAPQWLPLDLLQPFDMDKVDTGSINGSMLRMGERDWNFDNKGTHWLPHIWGTEGIAWRTDKWAPVGDAPSFGDIWKPEAKGAAMGRPHSMMLGAGLYMQRIELLARGDVWRAYDDEDSMRAVWDKIAKFCIERKANIKLFWDDSETQKRAFREEGVIVGQTWDGPPLSMKAAGEPITYQSPREGALAWVDGISLSARAENIDQVYEFIAYAMVPRNAGRVLDVHGYNSAAVGAHAYASERYLKNYYEAYPAISLAHLNPWPQEPQWYADLRTEYVNKFLATA